MQSCGVEDVEHRALLIARQQQGGCACAEMSVLGQQLVVVLEEAPPCSSLDFSGQSVLAKKPLEGGLLNYRAAALAIQSIVVIAAQLCLSAESSMGDAPRGDGQQSL